MNFRAALVSFLIAFPIFAAAAETVSLADRIQLALQQREIKSFLALADQDRESQENAEAFYRDVTAFSYQRVLVKQPGPQEPDKMLLHVFLEGSDEAKFQSWVVKLQSKDGRTVLKNSEVVSSVNGLFRLQMNQNHIPVKDLMIRHFDATFRLDHGNLFFIEAGGDVAGVLFVGKAHFQFDPKDPAERQQVTLFSKSPQLKTDLESMYIRSSPENLKRMFSALLQTKPKEDPSLYSKARNVAKTVDRNVYSVRLPFTDELWFTQLKEDEMYCEIKTASSGELIYQYVPGQLDDILLARKDRDQIISLYNSTGSRKAVLMEDDFEIDSYDMQLNYQPVTTHLSAKTRIKLLIKRDSTTIPFRLNPDLRVSQIVSEQSSLIYFQEKKTSNLHVVLNEPAKEGDEIVLDFYYQGKIPSEKRRAEAMAANLQSGEEFYMAPTFLYSSQSVWYPQLTSRPYAKADISITVPSAYIAVSNGQRLKTDRQEDKVTFTYRCDFPAKYFSLFVGRLDGTMVYDSVVPLEIWYLSLDRQAAEETARSADKILRFYSNYFGKYPYKNLTIVLRPILEPGGHAPATIAIVNRVYKFFQRKLGRDPLYIPEFPDFLLAHEIAHQWWGQSVGWETYRDQWLSEGFAQFAAWEYISNVHGPEAGKRLAGIFYRWIEEKTYAGPLILGARLGHITEDPQAFSALLYNKGAYTLGMLRNWMGTEKFNDALAEFYSSYQFKRVSVEDFKSVAEKHANQDLTVFFKQWLYGWDIPTVNWKQTSSGTKATIQLQFDQAEKNFYKLRIPIEARSKDGKIFHTIASIDHAVQTIDIDLPFEPAVVIVDPLQQTLMRSSRDKK